MNNNWYQLGAVNLKNIKINEVSCYEQRPRYYQQKGGGEVNYVASVGEVQLPLSMHGKVKLCRGISGKLQENLVQI